MRYVLLLLFICNASPNAFAQHVGIKNDVLWDAAMMCISLFRLYLPHSLIIFIQCRVTVLF